MSVECNRIRGFTYTMPYMREKFESMLGDKFYDFYFSAYDSEINKVYIVNDGMNGDYTRIVYPEKIQGPYCYQDGDDSYYKVSNEECPQDIYDKMNALYRKVYDKDLDKSKIEKAIWYHWS